MSELRRILAALGVLGSVASAMPARAASLVEWDAPAVCPDQAALAARLDVLLGESPERLGKLQHARAVVSNDPAGFRVVLEVTQAEGSSSRSFSARDCADLLEATALAVALAAHADAAQLAAAVPAPTNAATPAQSAFVSPGQDAPVPPPHQANAALHVAWFAAAEGVLDTGALPDLAPGLGLLVRARLRAVSADLYGAFLPTQRQPLPGGGRVEFGLLLSGLRGCYWPLIGSISAGACAGFELGQFRASGKGIVPARQRQDLWAAPSLGVEARQAIANHWQLLFRGEGVAPLARKQYVVSGNERQHAPAAVDVRLALGVSIEVD